LRTAMPWTSFSCGLGSVARRTASRRRRSTAAASRRRSISPLVRGPTGGFADFLAHGDARMAALAWKARPAFRIFPDFPNLLVRCKIPRGRGGTVAGLCEVKLSGPRGVAFLEHWPLRKPSGQRNTAGWIVTLDRSGRVVSVHGTGSTPPRPSSNAAGQRRSGAIPEHWPRRGYCRPARRSRSCQATSPAPRRVVTHRGSDDRGCPRATRSAETDSGCLGSATPASSEVCSECDDCDCFGCKRDRDCGSVAVLLEAEQRLVLADEQEDKRGRRQSDPGESE